MKNCLKAYLLLVFPLRVEACLNAFPGLLEGLPLGALSRVMGAHSNDIGATEDQDVGHQLLEKEGGEKGVIVWEKEDANKEKHILQHLEYITFFNYCWVVNVGATILRQH